MVQGALDPDLHPLLAALEGKKEVRIDAWTYWTGRIGGQRVVIARTDMGPVNAVASTVLGIQKFHPKAIINQGTAGAHNPDLKLWDIVVGDKTTDYGAFRSTHADAGAGIQTSRWIQMRHQIRVDDKLVPFPGFAGDAKLIEAAMKIGNPRGRVVKGNVGSAFQFNKEID